MTYSRFLDRTCKVCALVAVTSIVPALAFAHHDNDTSKYDENHHHEDNDRVNDNKPPIVSTPEANTGIVLIPFVGAVLLFSSVQLFRAMAAQKNGAHP